MEDRETGEKAKLRFSLKASQPLEASWTVQSARAYIKRVNPWPKSDTAAKKAYRLVSREHA